MKPLPLLRRPHVGRVLVVDGDARTSAALRLIVEFDGHEVRQAREQREALRLLEEFRPHVVLIDPSVTAEAERSLCEDVVAHPNLTQSSIILTSKTPERFDQRALRWISACVSRPFDFVELRLLVSRAVARATA
jgi:DNA-binding response OmpR family regulator